MSDLIEKRYHESLTLAAERAILVVLIVPKLGLIVPIYRREASAVGRKVESGEVPL